MIFAPPDLAPICRAIRAQLITAGFTPQHADMVTDVARHAAEQMLDRGTGILHTSLAHNPALHINAMGVLAGLLNSCGDALHTSLTNFAEARGLALDKSSVVAAVAPVTVQ